MSFVPSVSTTRNEVKMFLIVAFSSNRVHSIVKHSCVMKHPVDVHVVAGLQSQLVRAYS